MSRGGQVLVPIVNGSMEFCRPIPRRVALFRALFQGQIRPPLGTGLSITLFLYVVTLSLTGAVALAFFHGSGRKDVLTTIVLLLLVLRPDYTLHIGC